MMESPTGARDLPEAWDALCGDNYAMKRDFLAHLERGNPAGQRYHLFRRADGVLDSILVTFDCPDCNLLMFTPFTFRAPVTFVHPPLSVARPGCVIGPATGSDVLRWLKSRRGCTIIPNLPVGHGIAGLVEGRVCSSIRLRLRWRTADAYLDAMRSHYRHRCRKALRRGAGLRFRFLDDNRAFDASLYALYEAVHRRSRIRIEKLAIDYFQAPTGRILVCEAAGRPAGFVQAIENGAELVFAFAGLDYALNRMHDVYMNLLLKLVAHGIEGRFEVLELGQTAEDAKLRLGGELVERRALMHHSNPAARWVLAHTAGAISYRPPPAGCRVFRDEAPP